MRNLKLILFLAGFCSIGFHQLTAQILLITTQCTVIALPKAQALRFISEHHLDSDAAGGLKDLLLLVDEKAAESVANPAITTKSGQKATSEAGTTILEVEPVLSPDATIVDLNLQIEYAGKKISTSVTAKNGGVKFLGACDSTTVTKNMTYLVFVRVLVAR